MRNAEFDKESVLRAAMKIFMCKGYAKTSMQDLKQATGLHPGSIYCAFENKRGLLLAALEQYRQDRAAEFTTFFSGNGSVLRQLKKYLDNIVVECLSGDAEQACLSIKALNEIADQDSEVQQVITNNLNLLQHALADVFAQAVILGELESKRDSAHLARYFMMGIYGLRTFAHTHPQAGILQQLADQLYADVCI